MSQTVILDNGHGGIIGGEYQTKGKRSKDLGKGILYEGAFNRWIARGVMESLDREGRPYFHVSPELTDVPLDVRVKRANEIYAKNPNTYLLSIHANAGGGTGIEGFTSRGQTKSDIICDKFLTGLESTFKTVTCRYDLSDGDKDKEADFRVLKYTRCPAVLLELFFMDHLSDYSRLWNKDEAKRMVNSLVEVINDLYIN